MRNVMRGKLLAALAAMALMVAACGGDGDDDTDIAGDGEPDTDTAETDEPEPEPEPEPTDDEPTDEPDPEPTEDDELDGPDDDADPDDGLEDDDTDGTEEDDDIDGVEDDDDADGTEDDDTDDGAAGDDDDIGTGEADDGDDTADVAAGDIGDYVSDDGATYDRLSPELGSAATGADMAGGLAAALEVPEEFVIDDEPVALVDATSTRNWADGEEREPTIDLVYMVDDDGERDRFVEQLEAAGWIQERHDTSDQGDLQAEFYEFSAEGDGFTSTLRHGIYTSEEVPGLLMVDFELRDNNLELEGTGTEHAWADNLLLHDVEGAELYSLTSGYAVPLVFSGQAPVESDRQATFHVGIDEAEAYAEQAANGEVIEGVDLSLVEERGELGDMLTIILEDDEGVGVEVQLYYSDSGDEERYTIDVRSHRDLLLPLGVEAEPPSEFT